MTDDKLALLLLKKKSCKDCQLRTKENKCLIDNKISTTICYFYR